MSNNSYIYKCIAGDAFIDEIDDYVEYWHTHETGNSLEEFLGLSEYEYDVWCKNDDSVLRDILRCRVDGINFKNYEMLSPEQRKVARSYDKDAIEKMKKENE